MGSFRRRRAPRAWTYKSDFGAFCFRTALDEIQRFQPSDKAIKKAGAFQEN